MKNDVISPNPSDFKAADAFINLILSLLYQIYKSYL